MLYWFQSVFRNSWWWGLSSRKIRPGSTIVALQSVLSFTGLHHTVSPLSHTNINVDLHPQYQKLPAGRDCNILFIMKYNPLRWLVTWVYPLRTFVQRTSVELEEIVTKRKKKNVGYNHRLRLSLVRLVWTTACSLGHSGESITVSRSETLIPSTPKPIQYSAATWKTQ